MGPAACGQASHPALELWALLGCWWGGAPPCSWALLGLHGEGSPIPPLWALLGLHGKGAPSCCGHCWGFQGAGAPSCPLGALLGLHVEGAPCPARCGHCWGFMGQEPHPARRCGHCWGFMRREPRPAPLSQELQGEAVPAESTAPQLTGPHSVHGAGAGLGRGCPGSAGLVAGGATLLPPHLLALLLLACPSPPCFCCSVLGSVPFLPSPSLSSLTFLCPLLFLGSLPAQACSPPSSSFSSAGCVHEGPTGRPVGCGLCDHVVLMLSFRGRGESSHGPSAEVGEALC